MTQGLTGEPDLRTVDTDPNGDTIAKRLSDGRLKAAPPIDDNDVARKADIQVITATPDWLPSVSGPRTSLLSSTAGDAQTYAVGKNASGTILVAALAKASAVPKVFVSIDSGYTWKQTAALTGNAYGTSEVSIGVFVQDADNFSVAYGDNGGNVLRFASTINGGASWTVRSSASVGSANNFAVHMVDLTTAWYSFTLSTSVKWGRTADSGQSYATGTVAAETPTNYGTSVAAISGTTAFIAWTASPNNVRFAKSSDTGSTWSTAATIVSDHANGSGEHGLVAKDATTLILFYKKTTSNARAIARTGDGGTTWTVTYNSALQPVSAVGSGAEVCGTYDSASGTFMVAYIGSASISSFRFLLSTDSGQTWVQKNAVSQLPVTSPTLLPGRPIFTATYSFVLWSLPSPYAFVLQEIRKVMMA